MAYIREYLHPPGQKYSKRRILFFYQNQTVDILFVVVPSRKGSRIELKFPSPLVTLIYITKDLLAHARRRGKVIDVFPIDSNVGSGVGNVHLKARTFVISHKRNLLNLHLFNFWRNLSRECKPCLKTFLRAIFRRFDGPMPRVFCQFIYSCKWMMT